MPVKVLILAEKKSWPKRGNILWDKGDIISIRPVAQDFGTAEVPPKFIQVTISDVTPAQAVAYMGRHVREIDIQKQVNGSVATMTLSTKPGGEGPLDVDKMSSSKVATRLTQIGATVETEGDNTLTITLDAANIPKPEGVDQTQWDNATALRKFRYVDDFLMKKFRKLKAMTRFRISEAAVDLVLSEGGYKTVTKAQFLVGLRDKNIS